jgi:hypothetical protein
VSDAREVRGAHAPVGGIAEARRALVAWVDEAGDEGRAFLQARIVAMEPGRYEIRHGRDRGRPHRSLKLVSSDPFAAREIAQTTGAGEHRPLKTAPNLKRGWARSSGRERCARRTGARRRGGRAASTPP